jgi:pyrroloquinoline-quinone synthase
MDLRHIVLETTKENLIHRVRAHPFLERCRNGTITLNELKEFLVQQGLYSAYFTRYLCALMSNLPSSDAVLELAENLFEELGLDGGDSTPHHIIYRNMLEHFGLSIKGIAPTPSTRKLIDTMLHHCKNPNPSYGLGAICLGAEALVPVLYADIITGFTACGIAAKDIDFFRIHVECDDGHAETLRDMMVSIAADDTNQVGIMLQTGRALADARFDFFSGIESPIHAADAAQRAVA